MWGWRVESSVVASAGGSAVMRAVAWVSGMDVTKGVWGVIS